MTSTNKSSIRLLTGDRYIINKQINDWVLGFEKAYGENNILKMYADDFDTNFVIENIRGGGLFASRKMVIMYDIPLAANKSLPAGNKDQIEKFIDYFTKNFDTIDPDSMTLVFVSSTPDKRTSFYKFLSDKNNNIKIQESKYTRALLEETIENTIGGRYEDNQKDTIYSFFEEYYKDNLYGLENNLIKLQNFDGRLDLKNIKQICYYDKEQDSFGLIESLLSPEINLEEKNKIIEDIKSNDDNPFGFLGLFMRNIISICNLIDGVRCGYNDYKLLMSKVKIHPFAFGKLYKQKDSLLKNHEKIIKILDRVINLEYSIKSGSLPQEYFRVGFKDIMK